MADDEMPAAEEYWFRNVATNILPKLPHDKSKALRVIRLLTDFVEWRASGATVRKPTLTVIEGGRS
jgi:hypothetical protein